MNRCRSCLRPRAALATLLFAGVAAGADGASAQTDAAALPTWSAPFPAAPGAPRLGGPFDDLSRIHEVLGLAPPAGRVMLRLSTPDSGAHTFEAALLPVTLRGVANSAIPQYGNDGLLWAGRGLSMAAAAGARLRWGPVSAAIAPEMAWQGNRPFEYVRLDGDSTGYSPFAYPFHPARIDLPQRFGAGSFATVSPGQSYVRLDAAGVAAGFSTENLWWGPASRYPLMLGAGASGFPHAFLGTSGPLGIGIGTVEMEVVWGQLTESDYFDADPSNDHSMLLGVVGAFSPTLLPGLTIGAIRVYQYRPDNGSWDFGLDPLAGMFVGSRTNRVGNEMASLFARWVFTEAGAEAYVEWARDDRYNDVVELMQEPDNGQAYMIGLQKVTDVRDGLALRVQIEAVALQEHWELRRGSRPLMIYYTHHQVRQGYTHRGQVLGAWVGPGGDGQYLALDALLPWGMGGAYVERVRRADASAAALEARRWSPQEHDTELTVGLRSAVVALDPLLVSARLSFGHRIDRDFAFYDRNWGMALEATWTPTWEGWP